MLNPYYFTDRATQVGFNNTLDSHHINHANSKLTIKPNFPEFGIEFRYINKFLKEMAIIYARLLNQYIIKYQVLISAGYDKQNENGETLGWNWIIYILKY